MLAGGSGKLEHSFCFKYSSLCSIYPTIWRNAHFISINIQIRIDWPSIRIIYVKPFGSSVTTGWHLRQEKVNAKGYCEHNKHLPVKITITLLTVWRYIDYWLPFQNMKAADSCQYTALIIMNKGVGAAVQQLEAQWMDPQLLHTVGVRVHDWMLIASHEQAAPCRVLTATNVWILTCSVKFFVWWKLTIQALYKYSPLTI